MQAILDAHSATARDSSRKIESIAWFNIKNPDFILICDFAGICPYRLVNGINKKKHVVVKRVNKVVPKNALKQARA